MINNPAIMIYMENIDDKVNVSVLYNEPKEYIEINKNNRRSAEIYADSKKADAQPLYRTKGAFAVKPHSIMLAGLN